METRILEPGLEPRGFEPAAEVSFPTSRHRMELRHRRVRVRCLRKTLLPIGGPWPEGFVKKWPAETPLPRQRDVVGLRIPDRCIRELLTIART